MSETDIYVDNRVATAGVVKALHSLEFYVHDNLLGRVRDAENRYHRATWSRFDESNVRSPTDVKQSAFASALEQPDFDPQRGLTQDHAIDGVGVLYEQCDVGEPMFLFEDWREGPEDVYYAGQEALEAVDPNLPERLLTVCAESDTYRIVNGIRQLVRNAKAESDTSYDTLWDQLYDAFDEQHGVQLQNQALSPMDVADCDGHLPDLHALAEELYA